MSQDQTPTGFAERMIDRQPEAFSLRGIVARIFLRPRLFLFVLLVPPLFAVLFTALVPTEWVATTKILIRYGSSDTSLLKDVSPDIRLGLSGTTSAELIRSTPVLEDTIATVGIVDADIYRKPASYLGHLVTGMLGLGRSDDDTTQPATQATTTTTATTGSPAQRRTAALARLFKDSLDSSSRKSGSAQPIEILDKPSQMPDALKLDELISLEVRSYNREKVAAMANGLARAFIDEYYRIYAEEARRQARYLDQLMVQADHDLAATQAATPADFAAGRVASTSGKELATRDIPILASMAAQLTEIEGRLARATQVYARGAPDVVRLQAQAADLRFALARQERIEIGKQVLEQLRMRRYQAGNTETVYKDRLIPISIAESATTPAPSQAKKLVRIAVSGAVGTVLGIVLALSLMTLLSMLDPRIHVRRDIERLVGVPMLGHLAGRSGHDAGQPRRLAVDAGIEHEVLQMLTTLHQDAGHGSTQVVAITGASSGDGATFAAMAFALVLAKNRRQKVCLLDANLREPAVTRLFGQQSTRGFVEAIAGAGGAPPQAVPQDDLNLSIYPAGGAGAPGSLGYYADSAQVLIDDLRTRFDRIVIDAGPVLESNEAMILGRLADRSILVVASGTTRKGILHAAVDKMRAAHLPLTGIVLNRSRHVVPGFIYRNVF